MIALYSNKHLHVKIIVSYNITGNNYFNMYRID